MLLKKYIESLGPLGLERYADRCCIAISYLRLHVKYARKDPSVSLIRALARESEGHVSLIEVLEHFAITDSSSSKSHRKKAT